MNTAEVDLREKDLLEVETDRQAVYDELNRLLSNQRFAGAPQMSAFLRYVVTQTLEGHGNRIKAYTIGVDALGKPGTFDAQKDPSVRVLALRLRKALKSIYETEQPSGVIIDIKLGSYAPEFYQARVKPTKVVNIGAEPTSRLPSDKIGSGSLPGTDSVPLAETQHGVNAASGANFEKYDDTPAQPSSASIAWNRIDVLKSAHLLLILSAVMYSMALKLSDDGRQIGQILQSDASLSDMPVRLLSVSAPTQDSSGQFLSSTAVPSVLLAPSHQPSEQVKQIFILLSASMLEIGDIDVVMGNFRHQSANLANTDYVIAFNEVIVDSGSQIDAQIYRVDNGEVIANDTLQFDKVRDGFSSEEIDLIEKYAIEIADTNGALNLDFCNRHAHAEVASCKRRANLVSHAESTVLIYKEDWPR